MEELEFSTIAETFRYFYIFFFSTLTAELNDAEL